MSTSPDGREDDPAALEPGIELCARFVQLLPVAGASISVVTERGGHSIVGATDGLAAQLEARQFELGIGPHWEALRTERPAFLYRPVDETTPILWSQLDGNVVFGDATALFAFPLQLGEATVGVADLYSSSPVEPWSDEMIERAQRVARGITTAAVTLATRSANAASSTTGRMAVELRREVHQATGMVMAQLDCTASTALVRLRAYAFSTGIPLATIARAVTERRLDFADL